MDTVVFKNKTLQIAFVSLDKMTVVPPAAIAALVTYLKLNVENITITIIDAKFDDIDDKLSNAVPDILCISANTIDYGPAITVAQKFKSKNNLVIIGGIHITALPQSLQPCFDIGVIGEGEQTLTELIRVVTNQGRITPRDLKNIKGVIYRENGTLKYTEPRELLANLDELPIPDLSLFNAKYWKPRFDILGFNYGIYADMMSSKGCPFNCKFCASVKHGRRVRFKSAKRVVDEIEYLVKTFKVQYLFMEDDLFTINVKRINEIHDLLKERGILHKVHIACTARSDTLSDEICIALRRINVGLLAFGLESGSERMLKYLKGDNISLAHHKRAIALCKKYHFQCIGSLIFGNPTEEIKDIEESIAFIRYCKTHGVDLIRTYITTPYPGTFFWEIAKQRKIVSDDMDWQEFSMRDFTTQYSVDHPLLLDEHIDKKEFKRLFEQGRKEFVYFRYKLWLTYFRKNPIAFITLVLKNPYQNLFKLLRPTKITSPKDEKV